MSWGMVAGAAIGTAGTLYASNQASGDAKAARMAQKEQLDFSKEQYNDWLEVFGPIQDNLSEYYQNLTPETFAAANLQDFELEFNKAMTQFNESLVQRGIDPKSGIGVSLEQQAELDAAEQRAEIRGDARDEVNKQKASFLSLGLGINPVGQVHQSLSEQTRYAQNLAQQSQGAANQAIMNTAQMWGDAAYEILNRDNSGLTGGKK